MTEPSLKVDPAKEAIRREIWEFMEARGIARFPRPVYGRIPNFVGAEDAAERAVRLGPWRRATTIKANPDSPQAPLRRRALEEGKVVFMAVPRLREVDCFVALDPKRIQDVRAASSLRGALRLGRRVQPAHMGTVDLVLAGSVAVNRRGGRIGKGGGYSDLEFAIARTVRAVDEGTPVLTTVHSCQVLDRDLPMRVHDEPLDFIVTPRETVRTERAFPKPDGIHWEILDASRIDSIPILKRLRESP